MDEEDDINDDSHYCVTDAIIEIIFPKLLGFDGQDFRFGQNRFSY